MAATPVSEREDQALVELCLASGWSGETLGPDEIAVDLEVSGVYAAARLRREGGALVADCALARVAPKPPARRAALERLLERAGAAFRGVTVSLEADGDAHAARLAARCAAEPEALAEALGALAVAARRCVREAQALAADAALARAYLDHHAPR